jgi:hypothetical protein
MPFWELFLHRLSASPAAPLPAELAGLAQQIASTLAAFDPAKAAELLSALNAQVARRFEAHQHPASDAPAPAANGTGGAPRPAEEPYPGDALGVPRSEPVPPEMLAEILNNFNEEEVLAEMREAEAGGAKTLDQFIGELEELARRVSDPNSPRG